MGVTVSSSGWHAAEVWSCRRCWDWYRPAAPPSEDVGRQHATGGAVGGAAGPTKHMHWPEQQEPGGGLSHVQEQGGVALPNKVGCCRLK
jgi:hypothetical protein